MMVSTRYNKDAGNAAVAARLRNSIGKFWDFVLLAWVTIEVSNCWVLLTEVPDGDEFESLYIADVPVPDGGPWLVEAIVTAAGDFLGSTTTPAEAPDNATIQALRTDFTTTRAGKLDNLDTLISSRAAELTAQAILTDSQTHPTLAEIEGSAVVAKESTLIAIQGAQADIATGVNMLLTGQNTLLDIGQGDWEILNNQMIFYTRSGEELMRFNLLDKAGNATEDGAYKRASL